jgi:quinol-cytochrome oxidoreductase complex cytochrome b subunit
MRPNFFHHLHPPTIPAAQARWRYTLGAGGTAVFLMLVLLVTGTIEMFYYVATPAEAGLSIQTITYLVPFGGLIRNLHFWAAQLLIIVSAVHLVRIIFTGAYIPPRRFNYLLGLALFVIAILLNFTGYILRWDTGIQWALVVGTNLVKTIPLFGENLYRMLIGGTEPGLATLTRFYAWHIFGLTLVAVILTVWHAFRVRRDGGIALPPPLLRKEKERISRFELVRREVLAMLLTGAALLILSVFSPAPIAAPITEITSLVADARAPWFFLWVQQMLKWGDPFLWGVLVPLLVLLVIILIPYIFPKPVEGELGKWFPRSNRIAQITLAVIALLMILLTILGGLSVL